MSVRPFRVAFTLHAYYWPDVLASSALSTLPHNPGENHHFRPATYPPMSLVVTFYSSARHLLLSSRTLQELRSTLFTFSVGNHTRNTGLNCITSVSYSIRGINIQVVYEIFCACRLYLPRETSLTESDELCITMTDNQHPTR